MTRVWTLLLLLLMAVPTCAAAPELKGDTDRDAGAIKVGFIYNFTRFIRWPPPSTATAQADFVIAVVGDPSMYRQLTVLENSRYRVDDRPVRVERVANAAAIPSCSILFIGGDAVARIGTLLERLAKRPVLTIGDTAGLGRQGVAINFYRQRDRVRFEINPRALNAAGLSAEAQLFDVARIVE